MKRRQLTRRSVLGSGAICFLTSSASGQGSRRTRRIGVLLPAHADDAEYPNLVTSLLKGLRETGWIEGSNITVDIRWCGSDPEAVSIEAANLVFTQPDAIIAAGSTTTGPLLRVSKTIPVVFTIVPDPVAAGFVNTLAQPGGNATGFTSFEYGIGGKWVGLLKEVAPRLDRVVVAMDPSVTAGSGQLDAIRSASTPLGLEISTSDLRIGAVEIETVLAEFSRLPNGALIVTSSGLAIRYRDLLIELANRYNVPAIYYASAFAIRGGLMAFGPDRADLFFRAANYVDRILKGEKPSDLPIQVPTKYTLVVNLKTAQAQGISLSPALLISADEVIE